jgi:hypothetical protein
VHLFPVQVWSEFLVVVVKDVALVIPGVGLLLLVTGVELLVERWGVIGLPDGSSVPRDSSEMDDKLLIFFYFLFFIHFSDLVLFHSFEDL